MDITDSSLLRITPHGRLFQLMKKSVGRLDIDLSNMHRRYYRITK